MENGLTIQGYQELQAAARKLLDAAQPDGALGAAVLAATGAYAQGTEKRAHRRTGTLAASQTPEAQGLYGRVYTAPNPNPESGVPASVYAPFEDARGGSHGFYNATFQQDTPSVAEQAIAAVIRALP